MALTFDTILRSNGFVNQVATQTARVVPVISEKPIPVGFDGRVIWKDFLSPIFDQRQCSACYAFATIGSLSDKYAIQTLGQVQPVFNPLESAMCLIDASSAEEFVDLLGNIDLLEQEQKDRVQKACVGDSMYSIGRLLYRSGAVEDSCVPYDMIATFLETHGTLPECSAIQGPEDNMCCTEISKTPNPVTGEYTCYFPKGQNSKRVAQKMWPIDNFYLVSTSQDPVVIEKQIMLNLMRWGPLVMGFVVYENFLNEYDGTTIYSPQLRDKRAGSGQVGHAVRVVGWGEAYQEGILIKYWICANSWGTGWGDDGYFRIERVNPLLQMEINHMALWPQIPKMGPLAQFTVARTLMQKIDKAEREFIDVDPVTFYPASTQSKVENGELIGSLSPVIDPNLVPKENDFWASEIGFRQFMTPSGKSVGPLYDQAQLARGIQQSAGKLPPPPQGLSGLQKGLIVSACIIPLFIIAVVLGVIFYRRKHHNQGQVSKPAGAF